MRNGTSSKSKQFGSSFTLYITFLFCGGNRNTESSLQYIQNHLDQIVRTISPNTINTQFGHSNSKSRIAKSIGNTSSSIVPSNNDCAVCPLNNVLSLLFWLLGLDLLAVSSLSPQQQLKQGQQAFLAFFLSILT